MVTQKPYDQDKPLILLVDDIPSNLHVLVAALKSNYRLKTALSGNDALDVLKQTDDLPKLVIIDMKMPNMSGIEVLNRMRADDKTKDIPVILVSADSSEQNELAGLKCGADDFLVKPLTPSVLIARVDNLIKRHSDKVKLRLAAHVFEYSGEAIIITDKNNRIVDVNSAFTTLTGYLKSEVLGHEANFLTSGHNSREFYDAMWEDIHQKDFWQGEIWHKRKNGELFPIMVTISVVRNRNGYIDFHFANFIDISNLKAAHAEIEHLAHHDPLTGLPNRLHLQVYLEQSMMIAKVNSEQVVVMLLDLDRFKNINDTLGHSIGDQLLMQVSSRLKSSLRENDLVARLGGDEFVIVLRGKNIKTTAKLVADKICRKLCTPFTLGSHTLRTATSIGIAVFPDHAEQLEVLIKNADSAMYNSKSVGGGGFCFFDSEMTKNVSEKLELENQLHEAIDKQQFQLYYQPQFSLSDRSITGAEVLLRWKHPKKGNIAPAVFIPLAEETNQIYKIGEWVLNNIVHDIRFWLEKGLSIPRISINISAKQFQQNNLQDLVEKVKLDLNELHLPLELELEITETAVMTSPDKVHIQLQSLRGIGIKIAMDDFGQGYSSLGQLKNLPIDRLKIDSAFVHDISSDHFDKNAGSIAAATIALAHNLGFKVIAEGVEKEEHIDFLIAHGCDEVQGFYFAKPMPKEEFENFLR